MEPRGPAASVEPCCCRDEPEPSATPGALRAECGGPWSHGDPCIGSQVPGWVVSLTQARVGGRQRQLGIPDHARHLLLLPSLQAGCFGVQVAFWGEWRRAQWETVHSWGQGGLGLCCGHPWPTSQGRAGWGGRSLPRTCCSRPRITCTACCRISSLVCALSDLRCSWHMRPSSRKASLMSRTRTRSRALLAIRLSRSLRSFSSRDSTSSVLLGHSTEPPSGGGGAGRCTLCANVSDTGAASVGECAW